MPNAIPDLRPIASFGPAAEDPIRASIVIPVHGKWTVTAACLDAISQLPDVTRFEVVVVDDASPDETNERLATRADVRLVTTPTNLGFLGACNLGARVGRGDVIIFLNNDTLVHPRWLDSLVGVLDGDLAVGLVGSLLLGADGMVQESGGIIWSDGSGHNYGRGLPLGAARIRGLRNVDYCSGASIAIRRALFESIGGFDRRFAPAYYEDTDLCFSVRAAGFRVVVQPESVVTHLEGISHGRDSEGGIKRFQEVNRQAFRQKWAGTLPGHGLPTGPAELWRARNRTSRGLVLICDAHVPTPDRDAGSRRMTALVSELLAAGYSVHYAVAEHGALQPYTQQLERRGVTVLITEEEQEQFFKEAGSSLEVIMLCRPNVAWQYFPAVFLRAPQAVLIYDTVDLHALRLRRQAALEGNAELNRFADLVWAQEAGAMSGADVTLVVSEAERALLGAELPGADVRVLSLIHMPVVLDADPLGRFDIVFVGSYLHHPNLDGALWAATEILPRVRESVPDARLRLIGSNMPSTISQLDLPGVEPVGWLPDLTDAYEQARVVIAPLRFGAGVKGKVGEAIEFGVPVVGTTIAFEGMHLADEVDVLIADSPDAFAEAVVRLMTDDALWTMLSTHAQMALVDQFSPARAAEVLREVLQRSTAKSIRPSLPE